MLLNILRPLPMPVAALQAGSALAPVTISSSATFSVAENQTAIATLTASGGTGGPYTWTKIGGADTAKFTLTSGGLLTFATAPDFETPTDANTDNVYLVQVQADDGVTTPATQNISVTVTDVAEAILDLQFTTMGGTLDSRITLTRAGDGTYFDSSGILQTASTNVARFDHDPATLMPLGLLFEGAARTNIAKWNRDLTNVLWVKTNVSAVKDQTGIDGASNSASRITASAANGTCLQTVTSGITQRRQSAFVKRLVGSGTVDMTVDNGATWTTITVTGSWTRVFIPNQSLANPTFGFRIQTNADSIAVDYVHCESTALSPSSPIATTTANVTRAADLAVMTGTNFSSWFNASAGTFVVEFRTTTIAAQTFTNASDNTANERIATVLSSGGVGQNLVADGGVQQATLNTANTFTSGALTKIAGAFAVNDFAVCLNGGTVATDASGTLPTPDRMHIGTDAAGNVPVFGTIKAIQFWNTRKSNGDLQTLTT